MSLLLALLALGGVYYFYTASAGSSLGGGQNTTGGWAPVTNATPLDAAQLQSYAKVGFPVKFFIEQPAAGGSAIASPKAMVNGDVVNLEIVNTGGQAVRYWTVKLLTAGVQPLADGTPDPRAAKLTLPPVGTVFTLKDQNIFG
jgi:hypothetical protein